MGGAVFLVLVPTVYGLFADEIGNKSWVIRAIVLAVWIAVAVGLTVGAQRRDDTAAEHLARLVGDRELEEQQRIVRATESMLERIFDPRTMGIPECFTFTIYIYDADVGLLIPWWPDDEAKRDVMSFASGVGATGTAWARGELTLVTGEAVSNTEYGLTDAQQDFFRAGKVVVAAPVFRDGQPIGDLTAFSEVDDDYFEDPANQDRFRDLAVVAGVLAGAVADTGEV